MAGRGVQPLNGPPRWNSRSSATAAATALLDDGQSCRTVADILGNSEATLRLPYGGGNYIGKRKAISALELRQS